MSDIINEGALSYLESPQIVRVGEKFDVKVRSSYIPQDGENIVCHCRFGQDNQGISVGQTEIYSDECVDGVYVFKDCFFLNKAAGGTWSMYLSLSKDNYENGTMAYLGLTCFMISVIANE